MSVRIMQTTNVTACFFLPAIDPLARSEKKRPRLGKKESV
jgi:hypothetical protein